MHGVFLSSEAKTFADTRPVSKQPSSMGDAYRGTGGEPGRRTGEAGEKGSYPAAHTQTLYRLALNTV